MERPYNHFIPNERPFNYGAPPNHCGGQRPYHDNWRGEDFEYGVETRNRFFPLHDREGPNNQSTQNYTQKGRDYGDSRVDPPRSGANSQTQQNWGFPKANQGVKRAIENKEEPEGGGEHNQKKSKK